MPFSATTKNSPLQDENTTRRPASPYGIAKLFAHEMAAFYRRRFDLFVACGILFNHEVRAGRCNMCPRRSPTPPRRSAWAS